MKNRRGLNLKRNKPFVNHGFVWKEKREDSGLEWEL